MSSAQAVADVRGGNGAEPLGFRPGRHGAPAPPRLRGLPLVGNLPAFARDPMGLCERGYAAHGPVFRLRVATDDIVVIAGPLANQWMTKNERKCLRTGGIYDGFARVLEVQPDAVVLNTDGARHTALRRALRDGMARGYLDLRLPQAGELALGHLDEYATGDAFDAVAMAKRLAFRQLGGLLAEDTADALYDDFVELLDGMIATVTRPWVNLLPPPRRLKRARDRIFEFTDALVERLSPVDPNKPNRLAAEEFVLMASGEAYREDDAPMLVLAPYLAGLDTMAHLIAFCLWDLAKHADVAAEVVAELDAHVPANTAELAPATLKALTKTRAALMESMRIHDVSPGQRRDAISDFELAGYQVCAGDKVLVPFSLTHRLPECFDEPQRYDPTRFQAPRSEHHRPGVFCPYGVGTHVCLGAGMADVLLLQDLAILLRHFEVRRVDDAPLDVRWSPMAAPRNFRVAMRRRA